MGWVQKVRRRRAGKRGVFLVVLTFMMAAWFALTAGGILAYALVTGEWIGEWQAIGWFTLLGSAFVWWFRRYGPVEPMPGKTPEEHAADAFFERRDVRSGDQVFLPGDDRPPRRP